MNIAIRKKWKKINIKDYYDKNISNKANRNLAKNIWDLQKYGNRVFIGTGDFSNNAGPVPVLYYDSTESETNPNGYIGNLTIFNNIKKVDYDVLNILRTSTYEILFLDKMVSMANNYILENDDLRKRKYSLNNVEDNFI